MRHQCGAHGVAGAGHQLDGIDRHTGFMQNFDHHIGHQRRLLGRFGQRAVAAGQRRSHLAGKNRQRKVPRADAQHHAQRAVRVVVKRGGDLGGVVTQEIHRLAHFGNRVGQRLAGLANDQAEHALRALLQQVGGAAQAGGARRGRRAVPDLRSAGGAADGLLDLLRRGRAHPADGVARVGRVQHRLPAVGNSAINREAAHARLTCASGINALCAAQQAGRQGRQLLLIGQIQARRVQTRLRAQVGKHLARQRNLRVRRAQMAGVTLGLPHFGHRVHHQFGHRHVGVANAVDERGVGTVFQQTAHQVGQQGFVRADRRVDAARPRQLAVGDAARDLVVQRLAHAVQALEFVLAAVVVVAGHVVNAGHGLRVVGGKLRIDRVGRGQQLARAGQVRHIGVYLAGVDRVAVQAIELRALDLAVPVSALDQPDHQPVAAAAAQVDQMVDHVRAALQVSLHHKTNAVPPLECRLEAQAFQQVQRQLQPVGLFGVDVQADVVLARQQRQLKQARQQLGHHAVALGAAVARVQRRQLDRNARPFMNAAPVRRLADGMNRLLVRRQVALGVLLGDGGFAQHVVGIAKTGFFQRPAVGQRFGDGLAGDELLAHELHGAVHALADQRLAALADQPGQRRGQAFLAAGRGQLAGQHQAPDGGVDKHRRRIAQVRMPVAPADLVADQRVARGVVGNAQQRFGQAHQRHAFLAGQRKFLHQRFDAASVLPATQAFHQPGGERFNGGALRRIRRVRQLHQQRQAFFLGPVPGGSDGGAQVGLRQHVLRPVEERRRGMRHAGRQRRIVRFFGFSQLGQSGCTQGCTQRRQTPFQAFDILQDRLLDEPVRRPALLGCGLPDAVSKRFVNFEAERDCGHGLHLFCKVSATYFMQGTTQRNPG